MRPLRPDAAGPAGLLMSKMTQQKTEKPKQKREAYDVSTGALS